MSKRIKKVFNQILMNGGEITKGRNLWFVLINFCCLFEPFYKGESKGYLCKIKYKLSNYRDEAMKNLNLKEIKKYNNRELANYYCERYLGIK